MERRYNPLKMEGLDKLLQPLALMMAGLRKWDKPTTKKQAVGVDVVERLCKMGTQATSAVKDGVVGDWSLIAFYYLLRIGEYSEKDSRAETKQTTEFRARDVTLFEWDERKRMRQMPRNASTDRVMRAAGATLRLSN